MTDSLPPDIGLLNFSADRPIARMDDDQLGRGPFAISLANAIRAWRGKESIVLALYGPWGSGKSSVKNMVVYLLKKGAESEPDMASTIVEFNPWEWSGDNRLLEVFFEEIGTAIGGEPGSPNAEELSKTWKLYSARLALGTTTLESLKGAAEFAGIPMLPLILGAGAKALSQGSEATEKAAAALEAEATTKSLQQLKSKLNDLLSERKSPVLVVIDDIDRLAPHEIRTIFRLVKANADFPNMIYLLLCDRQIVECALEDASSDTGRRYVEKIVQAGFDLPQIPDVRLERALRNNLDALLTHRAMASTFDGARWESLFRNGLRHYCKSLRNIQRFTASLSFHCGMHLKEGLLEANVVDLIGIEALRLFEPKLYWAIAEHPELVFGRQGLTLTEETHDEERNRARELLANADDASRNGAEGIVRALFPQIDWILDGQGKSRGSDARWLTDLRICHKDVFRRYFTLSLASGDVSLALVNSTIAMMGNRESLRKRFDDVLDEKMFGALLQRLNAFGQSLELDRASPFVTALFDVGDRLTPASNSMFEPSLDIAAFWAIQDFLRREPNFATRSQILLNAMDKSDGCWLPVRLVSLESQADNGPTERLFDDAGMKKAKALCVAKIRKRAGELGPDAPFPMTLMALLFRWLDWGDGDEVRKYAKSLISTSKRAVQFLYAFSFLSYPLDLKQLAQLVDPKEIQDRLRPLWEPNPPADLAPLANEYVNVLAAAKRAFKPQAH